MEENVRLRGRPGATAPIAPMAAPPVPSPAAPAAAPPRIGKEQLLEWSALLNEYKAGKADVDRRVRAAEEWWKLRNTRQERREGQLGAGGPEEFHSQSGWLHNVIVSKHADAMDAFPEPSILPREPGDRMEARMLSGILPVVLEQNHFETTYSDVQWQRLKTGTGVYRVSWDPDALGGLGEISIRRVNLLDLFWEPGVEDLQESRCVFHVSSQEIALLEQQYPHARGRLRSGGFRPETFNDEREYSLSPRTTVIEVYYHRFLGGRKTLHYCKYVGDTVLYATENQPEMMERGLYDHGRYPFVLDRLFPVEGSPCGYGFVDLCRNPQTEIDLMKTAFVKNAVIGATPRFFLREDGEVNEEELQDLSRSVVHVGGNMGRDSLRLIEHPSLDGNHVAMLEATVRELRETSGNTETANGSMSAGVTAASAIAALQEASGKGSRDATQASYRAYGELVELLIELIRQFYTLPRQFRILGETGAEEFVSYSNRGLMPQPMAYGGLRLPVFDIKVVPQRRAAYSRLSQNELALQFYGLGFFDPARASQVLPCLEMMEFDGKEELRQKLRKAVEDREKLALWQQLALSLARRYEPRLVQGLMGALGTESAAPLPTGGKLTMSGGQRREHARVRSARQRAQNAPIPGSGSS